MNARRTSAAGVAKVPAAATTINLRRRGALALMATAVVATASLGVTATAYAKKSDDTRKDVRKSVACGTVGQLKLKAKAEDSKRLELEAEVDTNKAGQEWTVTLTNDGKIVWTGKRTTAGPSGSFSVQTIIDADATQATPTQSPSPSTTTTTSTTTSTSTTTASPSSSSTTTVSPTTSDASSSTSTAGKSSDDKPGDDKGGKGSDDKPGDDKGGQSKPATGQHVIGVTATLDTLTCATDMTF